MISDIKIKYSLQAVFLKQRFKVKYKKVGRQSKVANFKRLMVTSHFAIEVTAHLATCQFAGTISHLADITGQLDDSAPTNSVNSLTTLVNSLTTSVNSLTTSVNSLKTSVNSLTTSVYSLKTSVNSLTTSVNSLKTSVNSLTTSVNSPTIIFVAPFGILVGQMKPLLLINILKISFDNFKLLFRMGHLSSKVI